MPVPPDPSVLSYDLDREREAFEDMIATARMPAARVAPDSPLVAMARRQALMTVAAFCAVGIGVRAFLDGAHRAQRGGR